MDGIFYRKLALDDIEKFIELRKKQLLEEGALAKVDITNALLEYYRKHLPEGTFISWIASLDGDIIATSGISFVEQPPHYGNPSGKIGILSSMYTVEQYRRKGIAKKLLGLVVNEAKEYGCGAVHITASDMGAFLYQDFGFRRSSVLFRYKLV